MEKSFIKRTFTTRNVAILGMMAALSYILQISMRIPLVPGFRGSYEPSDVFILLAGFMINPLGAIIISFIVGILHMFTFGQSGWHGAVMNIASSAVFCGLASAIYHKFKSFKAAIFGLIIAIIATVGVMILLNIWITPIYFGMPREAVYGMILPAITPFNLLKYSLSAALFVMIYSPTYKALQGARLLPKQAQLAPKRIRINPIIFAGVALLILIVISLWLNRERIIEFLTQYHGI